MERSRITLPSLDLPRWLPTWLRRSVLVVAAPVLSADEWWQDTRVGRALAHFGQLNGGLQCGGLAYSALFSVFAALTLGYTASAAVLGSNQTLQNSVFDVINQLVPGLIDVGDGGVIRPDQLLIATGRGLASVIAIVVLAWSATAFMSSLRGATRLMLGVSKRSRNPLLARLTDLGGFFVLAVGAVVSAVATIAVTQFDGWLSGWVGDSPWAGAVTSGAGLAVSAVMDIVVVFYVVRVLAGAHPPRRDLWLGSGGAVVLFSLLRLGGADLVTRGAQANVFVASFAVIITLLLVVNFVARVLLLLCAWLADPPRVVE